MFGTGISKTGELVDMAVEMDIIKKSGSWFSYADAKLGQGRDFVVNLMEEKPELAAEIEAKVREKLRPTSSSDDISVQDETFEES